MLPRRLRLSRAAFGTSFPIRASSRHFSLTSAPVRQGGGGAVVVSKKVARLSTTRHQLKRRILAVARPWCVPSRAIVLYAKAGSPRLPFADLREELEGLLLRSLGPMVQ